MDARLLGWLNRAALLAVLAVMFLVDLGAGLLLLLLLLGAIAAADRFVPRGAIAAQVRRIATRIATRLPAPDAARAFFRALPRSLQGGRSPRGERNPHRG